MGSSVALVHKQSHIFPLAIMSFRQGNVWGGCIHNKHFLLLFRKCNRVVLPAHHVHFVRKSLSQSRIQINYSLPIVPVCIICPHQVCNTKIRCWQTFFNFLEVHGLHLCHNCLRNSTPVGLYSWQKMSNCSRNFAPETNGSGRREVASFTSEAVHGLCTKMGPAGPNTSTIGICGVVCSFFFLVLRKYLTPLGVSTFSSTLVY